MIVHSLVCLDFLIHIPIMLLLSGLRIGFEENDTESCDALEVMKLINVK